MRPPRQPAIAMLAYWDYALIFAALGILIPWRGSVRVNKLLARPEICAEDRLSIYASTIAFQWLLTGIIAWRCFARAFTLENLGLTLHSPGLTAIVTAGMAIGLCTLQYFGIRRIASMPVDAISRMREISLRLMPRSLIEALAFSALAATAAVCEEFIYRGFVYAALQSATSSAFIAIMGSSVLFSLAHLYQGRRGLASTFILGLVFAISRWATGNLIAATVTHLVVDLLAGYVAPGYFAKQAPAPRESEPAESA
jgi:membrane protease YdiL (CAAX protease family)